MKQIILIRHGQSQWNKENRFTGWVNVDLSPQGEDEAQKAGEILKKHQYAFDTVHTSYLKRAQQTAKLIMQTLGINDYTNKEDWRLNERHYGGLQGKNKKETAEIHGDEQVKIWRRSYDTRPPLLEESQAKELMIGDTPLVCGESLADTYDRVCPYWKNDILPDLQDGKSILVAAHGNSLRALMKYLFNISDAEIVKFEIPTGKPIQVLFDENFKALEYKYLE